MSKVIKNKRGLELVTQADTIGDTSFNNILTLSNLRWSEDKKQYKEKSTLSNSVLLPDQNVSIRGCLHMKFHLGMKLILGWNHTCLWWNVSYCLHVFSEMKFQPRMNSSRDERQRGNFIPGWNFKMSMFF